MYRFYQTMDDDHYFFVPILKIDTQLILNIVFQKSILKAKEVKLILNFQIFAFIIRVVEKFYSLT